MTEERLSGGVKPSHGYEKEPSASADRVISDLRKRDISGSSHLQNLSCRALSELQREPDRMGIYAGDAHARGLQLFNLGWRIDITKELNFSVTGRYFYANAVPDGFSRNIGLETDFTLTYAVNDNLLIIAGYDRFFTGGFFRDATGSTKDIDYGYLMLQFDLSKSKPKLKPVKG
jgi:hypothetical protein